MPHSPAAGGDRIWRPTRLAVYARDGWQCAICDWQPRAVRRLVMLSALLERGHDVPADLEGIQGKGATKFLSLDHLTPPSRRGSMSDTRNMVTCCTWCNSSKQARTIREFAPERADRIREQARRPISRELGRALCDELYPGWLPTERRRRLESRRAYRSGERQWAGDFFEGIAQGKAA